MRTHYEIIEGPLDVAEVTARVADPAAGATAAFVGTTRNAFHGKPVEHLVYEAYRPLAERAMEEIGTEIATQWPDVIALGIVHRLGRVEVGEASVVVAVSAPHRAEALAACGYGIDRLKATLPIWKKEVFADGEVWRENVEWDRPEGGDAI